MVNELEFNSKRSFSHLIMRIPSDPQEETEVWADTAEETNMGEAEMGQRAVCTWWLWGRFRNLINVF